MQFVVVCESSWKKVSGEELPAAQLLLCPISIGPNASDFSPSEEVAAGCTMSVV